MHTFLWGGRRTKGDFGWHQKVKYLSECRGISWTSGTWSGSQAAGSIPRWWLACQFIFGQWSRTAMTAPAAWPSRETCSRLPSRRHKSTWIVNASSNGWKPLGHQPTAPSVRVAAGNHVKLSRLPQRPPTCHWWTPRHHSAWLPIPSSTELPRSVWQSRSPVDRGCLLFIRVFEL